MFIDRYFYKLKQFLKSRGFFGMSDDPAVAEASAFSRRESGKSPVLWHYVYDIALVFLFLVLLFGIIVYSLTRAPRDFPTGTLLEVEEGKTLAEVAVDLREAELISHAFLFRMHMQFSGKDRDIVAGEYYFDQGLSMFEVGERIAAADFQVTPFLVTIPEGLSVPEIGDVLETTIASDEFTSERFVEIATPYEGYLFPDTYFFLPNTTEEEVVERMRENFEERIKEVVGEIEGFGRPLEEVIVMASLIEKEAYDPEDRRGISGVLWNRLQIDMPLQVDAVFESLIGRNTFELTLEDLGYDSPQNTYRYKGLPPLPIANPGLDAIRAAVSPTESNYLFYLADMEGVTHFCPDFECHKLNRARYGI